MALHKQEIGILDSFNIIKKSDHPLAPIKEAITNSVDSIKERRALGLEFVSKIDVSLFYITRVTPTNEQEIILDKVEIVDNGNGFHSESLRRFKQLADRSKKLNNRGTGKIQIFHRFKEILVDSIFKENNKTQHLILSYNIDDELEEKLEYIADCPISTRVTLNRFYGDETDFEYFKEIFSNTQLFKSEILKRLILHLFLEKTNGLTINLKIYENNKEYFSDILSSKDIPEPDKVEAVKIDTLKLGEIKKGKKKDTIEWEILNSDEELILRRFKLPVSMSSENGVFLCSKDLLVEKYNFPILRKNTNFNGFHYLTSVSGAILDKDSNVKHTADGFLFPTKKEIEKKIRQMDMFNPQDTYIFLDEIEDKLDKKLNYIYTDLQYLKDEKEQTVAEIAKLYGINPDLSKTIDVGLNDSHEDIAKKLFEVQSKVFAVKNIEIQKTYNELVSLEAIDLDPSSTEYEKKFQETSIKLMNLIPQQNKDELARYVIRRDMVVRLLRLALKNELVKQRKWLDQKANNQKVREEQEGLIHDLIFKRKTKNTLNDLWILNEEFTHFQGLSDLPLEELEVNNEKLLKGGIDIQKALDSVGLTIDSRLEKRPDIFLYPEEGKCILIEFKAPKVDLTKHLDQIAKYAKLIANYSSRPITQFYGFLIGENVNKIEIPGRYIKSHYNGYWFYPNEPILSIETDIPIANIYQEIVPFSTMADRAYFRNKSFSDKLGITLENENKTDS